MFKCTLTLCPKKDKLEKKMYCKTDKLGVDIFSQSNNQRLCTYTCKCSKSQQIEAIKWKMHQQLSASTSLHEQNDLSDLLVGRCSLFDVRVCAYADKGDINRLKYLFNNSMFQMTATQSQGKKESTIYIRMRQKPNDITREKKNQT
jgi:hypothetical protein